MEQKKITVISGTRKGIGEHLARHYLALGHIVIGCSRKPAEFTHESYQHFALDITDENAVVKMFEDVLEAHGRLDHLVNNAAIGGHNAALLTPTAQVEQIMATNFTGSFRMSREAARIMARKKHGRIVNFTSIMVPQATPGHLAYICSKAAVESMTRVLAQEWGPLGITVNAVGPSAVSTDLLNSLPAGLVAESVQKQSVKGLTAAESIAEGVDFFLLEKNGRVTGQVLYYGGAW